MSVTEATFQQQCRNWLVACMGEDAVISQRERAFRFLEEAIELAQAVGVTEAEAAQIAAYVFSRPAGAPVQELGGTMCTLASLSNAIELDMEMAGRIELDRCWSIIDKIRAKALAKRTNEALPGVTNGL